MTRLLTQVYWALAIAWVVGLSWLVGMWLIDHHAGIARFWANTHADPTRAGFMDLIFNGLVLMLWVGWPFLPWLGRWILRSRRDRSAP